MNIFVVSIDLAKCARYLDDKRLVKMCLETTQMLCTAINETGGSAPYKSTHVNHPCNKWARESVFNWHWLYNLGAALCLEYVSRFNKVHKCWTILCELDSHTLPDRDSTPWPNCARNTKLGIDYTHIEDIFEAYQKYLEARWIEQIKDLDGTTKSPVICTLREEIQHGNKKES